MAEVPCARLCAVRVLQKLTPNHVAQDHAVQATQAAHGVGVYGQVLARQPVRGICFRGQNSRHLGRKGTRR